MPFQLSGNVRRGGIIEIPFGLPLRELIERYGGGTLTGRPIGAIQVGGPLGAYLLPEAFDTPLTYEAMQAIGAGIGHGGIVVSAIKSIWSSRPGPSNSARSVLRYLRLGATRKNC